MSDILYVVVVESNRITTRRSCGHVDAQRSGVDTNSRRHSKRAIAFCGVLFDVHNLLESFAEFRIENGVDNGIDEAVHVAQPGGEDECGQTGIAVHAQFGAECVQHVAGEEGHPAN